MGLSGIFLGSLTLLNVLGTSKFIDYSFHLFNLDIPFVIAIGVLPYPFTFLCTDLISELYGRKLSVCVRKRPLNKYERDLRDGVNLI